MRMVRIGNLTEQEAEVMLRAVTTLRKSMTDGAPGARAAEKLQMRIGKLILTGWKKKSEM